MTHDDDRQAIHDVLLRHMTALDLRDWALYATCFTEDCVCDIGDIGSWKDRESLVSFEVEYHAAMGRTLHHLSNVSISVDGDSAKARSYGNAIFQMDRTRPEQILNVHGAYDDVLVRTSEGWRISHRAVTVVSAVPEQSHLTTLAGGTV
jgi:3-phenylpropionate/cinnamic acid dioxygenase small subunit